MIGHLFLTIFLLSVGEANAGVLDPNFISAEQYLSGEQVCEKWHDVIGAENGKRVDVPIDYSYPEKGMTSIYAYFENPFDESKPTLIFFNGGPGEASHQVIMGLGFEFNILRFDVRGVGCSRPKSFSLYRDPSFYSSENIARDADLIRAAFSLEQVSVWGVSYGTIPANVYAHLFPERTRALVLEGVVFSGGEELWVAEYRRKWLSRQLELLSAEEKQKIYEVGLELKLPSYWWSLIARQMMSFNDGIDDFIEWSKNLLIDEGRRQLLQSYFSSHSEGASGDAASGEASSGPQFNEILDLDQTVYGIMACKEMSLGDAGAFPLDDFDGKVFVRSSANFFKTSYCDFLGIKPEVQADFQAIHYPVQVPVTYFQGAWDGSTTAPMAVQHFKEVAQGQRQIFILPKGGHNPNLGIIYDNHDDNSSMQSLLQLEILTQSLQGKIIQPELLKAFDEAGPRKWAHGVRSKN